MSELVQGPKDIQPVWPNREDEYSSEITRLRAENEKLHRETAIRIDQIEREQEAHLRTIDDYNSALVENEKLRDAYDTDTMTISYNLGYSCGKDIAKDEIERLRGLLREAHVKMVENDLWVNLRQRVAAAIRESGDE